jgi:uncharacterized protein YeaC (DUF1315 family)
VLKIEYLVIHHHLLCDYQLLALAIRYGHWPNTVVLEFRNTRTPVMCWQARHQCSATTQLLCYDRDEWQKHTVVGENHKLHLYSCSCTLDTWCISGTWWMPYSENHLWGVEVRSHRTIVWGKNYTFTKSFAFRDWASNCAFGGRSRCLPFIKKGNSSLYLVPSTLTPQISYLGRIWCWSTGRDVSCRKSWRVQISPENSVQLLR